jgi:hypothetical protein
MTDQRSASTLVRAVKFFAYLGVGLWLLQLTSGCSDEDSTPSKTSTQKDGGGSGSGGTGNDAAIGTGGTGAGLGADAGCDAIIQQHALDSALHVAECTPIQYSTKPPASGKHHPKWANFESFDFALPRGYWMHSLEHGAIVFSYNCPEGCEGEVAAVQAFIDALPPDPDCSGAPLPRRVRLPRAPSAPADPSLPHRPSPRAADSRPQRLRPPGQMWRDSVVSHRKQESRTQPGFGEFDVILLSP